MGGAMSLRGAFTPDARRVFRDCLRLSQSSAMRKPIRFAAEEIILPFGGPFGGKPWTPERLPFAAVWLRLLESTTLYAPADRAKWFRAFVTGPKQSGKTLNCWVILLLYILFERREPCGAGVPNLDMVRDKWRIDLLPVIQQTRYADLLPRTGSGSRGGVGTAFEFLNGVWLRFFTGGGGDKGRAAATFRNMCVTECNGFDEAGSGSHEADGFTQLEGRTLGFTAVNLGRFIMGECTQTVTEGRVNQEITQGTDTRIAKPCLKCGEYVTPEREHLIGWEGAENIVQARKNAIWTCPKCETGIDNIARGVMNRHGIPVHRGQSVDWAGRITGAEPETDTLGFRYSAFDNMLQTAADVGAAEWRAAQAANPDNAERSMCQDFHARPYVAVALDTTPLDRVTLMKRKSKTTKSVVPNDCEFLVIGADVGLYMIHWIAVAVSETWRFTVSDYGVVDCPADDYEAKIAIRMALQETDRIVSEGFPWDGHGCAVEPDAVLVDSNYQTQAVCAFTKTRPRWIPVRGQSAVKKWTRDGLKYKAPDRRTRAVSVIGDNWHFKREIHANRMWINVDEYKRRVHQGLRIPEDNRGAIRLYRAADAKHHHRLTVSLMAEAFTMVAKNGIVAPKWVVQQENKNHWLDALAYALAGASYLASKKKQPKGAEPLGWFERQRRRGKDRIA